MKTSGFTVFELVVVIAMIAVLTLIGMPVYKRLAPNIDLETASRDLVSDLRHAQQLAVTEQVGYRLTLYTDPDYYQIINAITAEVIKNKIFKNQINIDAVVGLTNNAAVFSVTGAVQDSGQITLINSRNHTTTIDIKPSGYVKILE